MNLMMLQVMGSDHLEEKTELLHALINDRKLSDLPKINQVAYISLFNCKQLLKPWITDGVLFLAQLHMQPTLIIWGEQDQVFPMELAQVGEVSLVLPSDYSDYKWQADVSNILSIAKLQFYIPQESWGEF